MKKEKETSKATVKEVTKASNMLLKRLMKATGNEFGAIADEGLSSDITSWSSTGCYLWNMQVSGDLFKGMPAGKVVGLAGPSGTMKTYACISVMDSFLKLNPNGSVFIFDSENAITKDRLIARGTDISRIVHLPVSSLSDFKHQCFQLLKEINADPDSKDSKFMLVLDSLGALPSVREIKNADEGNTAADFTRSKDIRSIFRTLTVMLSRHQIPMLVTSHTYASIGAHGAPQQVGGGCLTENHKVLMNDGGLKGIPFIEVGDFVQTLNGPKKVTETFKFTKSTITLELADGSTIECTENHKFLVELKEGTLTWKTSGELVEGDEILKI